MNSQVDLSELNKLIEDEKFDEAKSLMTSYFQQPMTAEERGQAYLDVADMYLEISNYFNRQRVELLEKSAKALDKLDKQVDQLDELIDLDKIRKQLKDS